jgi:flavin-binding protein dodecin
LALIDGQRNAIFRSTLKFATTLPRVSARALKRFIHGPGNVGTNSSVREAARVADIDGHPQLWLKNGATPTARAFMRGQRFLTVTTRYPGDTAMAESVYKVIELVGTSTESWEKAASAAITQASKSLRDLRVAEVSQLDLTLTDGKVETYRAKVKVSFKYED